MKGRVRASSFTSLFEYLSHLHGIDYDKYQLNHFLKPQSPAVLRLLWVSPSSSPPSSSSSLNRHTSPSPPPSLHQSTTHNLSLPLFYLLHSIPAIVTPRNSHTVPSRVLPPSLQSKYPFSFANSGVAMKPLRFKGNPKASLETFSAASQGRHDIIGGASEGYHEVIRGIEMPPPSHQPNPFSASSTPPPCLRNATMMPPEHVRKACRTSPEGSLPTP